MARKKSQEISRRAVTEARYTEPERLAVQADISSARGHSAIGAAALSTLGRLGDVANTAVARRTAEKFEADATAGQAERTAEVIRGEEASPAELLAEQTHGYRRGYYVTEGINRIHRTQLELTRAVAGMEPGADIDPVVREKMAALLESPEFQDPAVRKQLAPALQKMEQAITEVRVKTELAEIFERQSENLSEFVRNNIEAGALFSAEGVATFKAFASSEDFGALSNDEQLDILAAGYEQALGAGTVDPEQAAEFLKSRLGDDDVSFWDRAGWADKFETAARAGAAVRDKAIAESQAEAQAEFHHAWSAEASAGRFSRTRIFEEAGKLGLEGGELEQFVRRWENENAAGIKAREAEAKAAARHREVVMAINAGNLLTHTDAQLEKSGMVEWQAAIASGDPAKRAAVLHKYHRAGIVLKPVRDLMGRPTESNLGQIFQTYKALADLDKFAADAYLTDDTAGMVAAYTRNVTLGGMSHEEAIREVPSKIEATLRKDVAPLVQKAATDYFKENATMPDGSPLPPRYVERVTEMATRQAVLSPYVDPKTQLQAASARLQSTLVQVNGRWVDRGGARPQAVPGVNKFVEEAGRELEAAGTLPKGEGKGVFAAPHPDDPTVFIVMRPDGFPAVKPGTRQQIVFDPQIVGQAHEQYEQGNRRAAGVRAAQAEAAKRPSGVTVLGLDAGAEAHKRTTPGTGPKPGGAVNRPALPVPLDETEAPAPVPSFVDFLSTFKPQGK